MKTTYRSTTSLLTNPTSGQMPKYQSKAGDPELQRSFRGHKNTVTSVCFSSNMKYCLSGAKDGVIEAWNFKPQSRPFEFVGHKAPIHKVIYHPTGKFIASASSDETVILWTNAVNYQKEIIKSHSAPIRAIDFSKDGSMLLTGSDDKTLKTWNLKQRKIKGRDRIFATFSSSILGHTNWIRSAQFSPDARLIVSGSDDKTVKLWDIAKKKNLNSFVDHLDIVRDVRFHPDGTCVASGSNDCTIKLWDLRSKRLLQHYDAHDGPINQISFHPNGKYLISASDDNTAKIWDIRMGNILFTLYGHEDAVSAINFSECGDYFATGGEDTIVNVWKSNLDSNKETETLEDVSGLVSIGGMRETTIRPNIDTYLVDREDAKSISGTKKSPSKPRLHTQNSTHSGLMPGQNMKSDRTRSDIAGGKYQYNDFIMKTPEDEFYSKPSKVECIPDTAFSKQHLDNVPHEISSTVSKIVNQLDILSNTLQLLDQRITANESQAKDAIRFFRELNQKDAEKIGEVQRASEDFHLTPTHQ
ncbi:unnamed protein product [Moneuplotes crassus]|uniref:Uncharacterized protein n=1 Tax=Euplotes crassus TaxID=5936 RepID=A0AAD1XBM3_EUPCR|nr:unnamed protein product [Moneuplotes crassus]